MKLLILILSLTCISTIFFADDIGCEITNNDSGEYISLSGVHSVEECLEKLKYEIYLSDRNKKCEERQWKSLKNNNKFNNVYDKCLGEK